MVFWMLKSFGVRPKINEVVGRGGADFVCPANFGSPILARREPPPEGAFGVLTRSVFAKVKDKATQLAGYDVPRMLAIASSQAWQRREDNRGGRKSISAILLVAVHGDQSVIHGEAIL